MVHSPLARAISTAARCSSTHKNPIRMFYTSSILEKKQLKFGLIYSFVLRKGMAGWPCFIWAQLGLVLSFDEISIDQWFIHATIEERKKLLEIPTYQLFVWPIFFVVEEHCSAVLIHPSIDTTRSSYEAQKDAQSTKKSAKVTQLDHPIRFIFYIEKQGGKGSNFILYTAHGTLNSNSVISKQTSWGVIPPLHMLFYLHIDEISLVESVLSKSFDYISKVNLTA